MGGRMSLAAYLSAAWWGIAAVSLSLAWNADVVRPWLVVASGALAAWALIPRTERFRGLKPSVWLLGVFALFVFVRSVVKFMSERDAIYLIGESLCGLLPVFLASRQKVFGYWMAILTSFLLSLSGVVAEGELVEYALFLTYLCLLVVNLNASNLAFLAGPSLSQRLRLPAGYFRQFGAAGAMGLVIGGVIYIAFPREYTWMNPLGVRGRNKVTGYTGSVSLDGIKELGESTAVAMQVESTDVNWLARSAPNIYFRGNTLDTFNGRTWSHSGRDFYPFSNDKDVRFLKSVKSTPRQVKIFREPNTSSAILYPYVLLGAEFPWTMRGGIRHDESGSLVRMNNRLMRYSYEMVVTEPSLPPNWEKLSLRELRREAKERKRGKREALALYELDAKEMNRYLQIPKELGEREYFKKWISEVGPLLDGQTISELTLGLLKHFQTKFTASLVHDFSGLAPFESFLTSERRGHCEYFASAAAMYYRSAGIPARLVLGYHGGTFNTVSRSLEVRELNAHAWVEIFIPGSGWVTIDPTPLVMPGPRFKIVETLRQYLNAATFWFNRYVVDYNTSTQRELIRSFFQLGDKNRSNWKLPWAAIGRGLLVASLLGLIYAVLRNRRWVGWNPRSRVLPDYYRLFQRKMAQKGLERETGESYHAFHRRLIRRGIDRDLVERVDGALEEDLYTVHPQTSRRELRRSLAKATLGLPAASGSKG